MDVDVQGARTAPGILGAWSAPDVLKDLQTIPRILPRIAFDDDVQPYLQPVLAHDRVRYVGEPVAVVVAEDRYLAEDAAELVTVEIEPLPLCNDLRSAEQAESLFPGQGNLVSTLTAEFGDPDGEFAAAEVRIEADITVGRHTGMPMETRGVLVDLADNGDGIVVYGAAKVPHNIRDQLAKHLGIPAERIRVIETAVGGSFGVRGEYYPEDFLTAWAALKLQRPVSWIEDRREHLLATNHSREQVHSIQIAGTRDGRILAVRSRFWADMGAYVRTVGLRVPENTLTSLLGPYDIPSYEGRGHCVVTNRTPTGTVRGPGRFEASFVIERAIDLFAAQVGMSPVAVRERNLIRVEQMPYERPLVSAAGVPIVIERSDYRALLDRVLRELEQHRASAQTRSSRKVGVGVGLFLEKSGLGPWEKASVSIPADGGVTIRTGCPSVGQGVHTILAKIAAECLDIDPSTVSVELVDTHEISAGVGTFASRATTMAGNAVLLAVGRLLDQSRIIASRILKVQPADLVVSEGGLAVQADPSRRLSFAEIAAIGSTDDLKGTTLLKAEHVYEAQALAYSFGAHGVILSVDEETFSVEVLRAVLGFQIGRALDRTLVEGQLRGAAVQAMGGALLENLVYDDEGNPLVTSFMDYLMPTAEEAPVIDVLLDEDARTETNPLGVRGCGEAGIPGIAAAIAQGIEEALGRAEIILDVPITPSLLFDRFGGGHHIEGREQADRMGESG